MAKKSINDEPEEVNKTYEKIISILKDANIQIHYPICVNTYNHDKEYAHISCNFMGTNVKVPLSEINFDDFKCIDRSIMQHNATWTCNFDKKHNKLKF